MVLLDGSNMNAWAKMKEKDWLTEDGALLPADADDDCPAEPKTLLSALNCGPVLVDPDGNGADRNDVITDDGSTVAPLGLVI